jgi:hypothetical protein
MLRTKVIHLPLRLLEGALDLLYSSRQVKSQLHGTVLYFGLKNMVERKEDACEMAVSAGGVLFGRPAKNSSNVEGRIRQKTPEAAIDP